MQMPPEQENPPAEPTALGTPPATGEGTPPPNPGITTTTPTDPKTQGGQEKTPPTTEDTKKEGTALGGEPKKEEEAKPEPKAPESYEPFEMPDGFEMDKTKFEAFVPIAKELDLTQEQAQKLASLQAEFVKGQYDDWSKTVQDWGKQLATDKELGGTDHESKLSVANKAVDAFGTPELRELLNNYGVGNHPEMVRFAYRVGQAIGEGKTLPSNPGAGERKDPAEILYGKM